MKITTSSLLLLLIFTQTAISQELLKSNFSSFSQLLPNNDTLLITSSQSINTFNNNESVLNGYFPLFYSTLNLTENNINYLNVFPNPFNSIVYINSSINKNNFYTIKITNLQGKIVYQSNEFLNYINLSEIEAGVYFISIQTNDDSIITKKIVKN